MSEGSPYANVPVDDWHEKTSELLAAHPLSPNELVEVVISSWRSIFESRIGTRGLRIGEHLFPSPQILGFFLHELIPNELATRHPSEWRKGDAKGEKDLVYIPSAKLSVEIKTSSHPDRIFGNRSYAQEGAGSGKFGYYLAVNFDKCTPGAEPCIRKIRFGWLDHLDWIAQRAPTGQQARLSDLAEKLKLATLFPKQ